MNEIAYRKLYTAAQNLAAYLGRNPKALLGNVTKTEFFYYEEIENALFEIDNGCPDDEDFGYVEVKTKYKGD